MKKREKCAEYILSDSGGTDPVVFSTADDYLAFIVQHSDDFIGFARRGFAAHGRGIVVLEGPRGARLECWYVNLDDDDFEHFQASAREDYERYEPAREMLAGVADNAAAFFQFWRIGFGK
jgi:hypothetical protein